MLRFTCALSLVAVLLPLASSHEPPGGTLTEDEAAAIGGEAYIFGYPLVLMDVTARRATNVSKVSIDGAPMNQFSHRRAFPTAKFSAVVSPNADTLYSSAFLDLSSEPMILSVPATERYYMMQLLDAWTNVFAAPGTRTTGTHQGDFAIVGPAWRGSLPDGLVAIKAPTQLVWLLGRTQTNGKADYATVHKIQDQYKLVPLSAWKREYLPPDDVPVDKAVDRKTPPPLQVEKMDAHRFLSRVALLMKDNPPHDADRPLLVKLARVGIAPGKQFDLSKVDMATRRGLERGISAARGKLAEYMKTLETKHLVNGWSVRLDLGRYGTDYWDRAAIARIALAANLPEDTIYPLTHVDEEGVQLRGDKRYVLRFPKGQVPPARAFWSLTLYNAQRYFVENRLDRHALGDRDKLRFDEDGSLTIYLQHESPGEDKESNWLPAPKEDFNLALRLYWPKKEALEGVWRPPPVERVR